jgi:hypothetical protein
MSPIRRQDLSELVELLGLVEDRPQQTGAGVARV